uniref:SAM domain-containing protein n=1 Tax=Aegilops tauschii subsp. strangulata TaxID=200361 RepID=A0A453S4Q5_AEGTS
MSDMDVQEPPSEVSIGPSRSVNIVDEDDDWVIVKKQRITILIPPLSPAAASPQAGTPIVSSRQVSLPRMSRRNCNAATKKHPKMKGESSRSAAAPVVRSEWTKHADHAVEGLSHQATEKATSPLGNMYDPGLPVISSNVTNKVLRARLLQRRVARFGGLRNWLLTCGLGWFVKILDSEGIGMYQMVSLTMNQLKEMGLIAVGPRRKLIHAIDSLCKPGQFEMFS